MKIMDSFLSWIGGKKLLKERICERFPNEIGRYIEVFGGAGWVLFHKDQHAALEVYNDVNSDLVNLFKCVKFHCPEVQRELQYMLNSRELFMQYREQYNFP
jgi:DNA adenine methylase